MPVNFSHSVGKHPCRDGWKTDHLQVSPRLNDMDYPWIHSFVFLLFLSLLPPNADISGRLASWAWLPPFPPVFISQAAGAMVPTCCAWLEEGHVAEKEQNRDSDFSSRPQPLDALWMQVRRKWPLNDDRLLGAWSKWGQETSTVQISFPVPFGALAESFKERKESIALPWL